MSAVRRLRPIFVRGSERLMWGTSSRGDELTGDFANELDAISIDDRGLFRPLAGKLSQGNLGLLQQNRPEGDMPVCLKLTRYFFQHLS
jgi:hypothetical protein